MRVGRKQLEQTDERVIELSETLQHLPIHPPSARTPNFRNPAGVSMKLANFLALDPNYPGQALSRGGRLDREVWESFADHPYQLERAAEGIAMARVSDAIEGYRAETDEEKFSEGEILTRLHRSRERKPQAIKSKKEAVLRQTGALRCEVCSFDFAIFYGEIGHGFAECHHLTPISELRPNQRTTLRDLAIVCANCHRMLHRGPRLLTLAELRAHLAG
ncbi:MAG: HNH endonuclease [Rhodothermales bacterium]|nr:HNH endonuclease [Rhodothermales bacterium]